jgi:hypothetical protein
MLPGRLGCFRSGEGELVGGLLLPPPLLTGETGWLSGRKEDDKRRVEPREARLPLPGE